MVLKKWAVAVLMMAGSATFGIGSAAGQTGNPARQSAALARVRVPAGLPRKAAFMYRCVMERPPGALKWQQIPWLGDYPEAIRQARAENRPILLWTADEDPLERC